MVGCSGHRLLVGDKVESGKGMHPLTLEEPILVIPAFQQLQGRGGWRPMILDLNNKLGTPPVDDSLGAFERLQLVSLHVDLHQANVIDVKPIKADCFDFYRVTWAEW